MNGQNTFKSGESLLHYYWLHMNKKNRYVPNNISLFSFGQQIFSYPYVELAFTFPLS